MGKRLLTIMLALILLLAGLGLWALSRSDDGNNQTNQTANEQKPTTKQPGFAVTPTNNVAYLAVIAGAKDGKSFTANLESDGKGNTKYTGNSSDGSFEMYVLGKRTIVCNAGNCYETTGAQSAVPVTQNQYTYTEADIAKFQKGASYKGKQACPAGRCDVWGLNTDTYKGEFFLDTAGRISKASGTSQGSTFEVVYTYKNVTVTAPENVRSLPNMQ